MTRFLEGQKIELMGHPPDILDMAPRDFYLLSSVKNKLCGKHFSSGEEGTVRLAAPPASPQKITMSDVGRRRAACVGAADAVGCWQQNNASLPALRVCVESRFFRLLQQVLGIWFVFLSRLAELTDNERTGTSEFQRHTPAPRAPPADARTAPDRADGRRGVFRKFLVLESDAC
ncbi:hypothetical protein EVAR_69416_1 [Eumeta japonica]|uniref:Uncharacterized protein n=1 Tax=Eumeta variegata TaxID=151549 RepID=A0A4C1ZAU6_EUMVA|nr:hypothetical protein EVAR_69416_1 [Eumeta japonica]